MTPAANDRDEARYEKRRAESRAHEIHPDGCCCRTCAVDEWDGQP